MPSNTGGVPACWLSISVHWRSERLLILASLFGAGHDADVHVDLHVGGDGHGGGDGHDQNQASAWLSLFGLRFWSFGDGVLRR